MSSRVVHAVLFEDRGWWVAQYLEHNLTASSKNPRELPRKLETVLKVQIEADLEAGKVPFSTLPSAPRRFWKLFQDAEPWGLDDSTEELPVGGPAWTELALASPSISWRTVRSWLTGCLGGGEILCHWKSGAFCAKG